MGKIKSGLIVVGGPNVAAAEALRPGSKTTFSFQRVSSDGNPVGSAVSVEVSVIRINPVENAPNIFRIIYSNGRENLSMMYNAAICNGVVMS